MKLNDLSVGSALDFPSLSLSLSLMVLLNVGKEYFFETRKESEGRIDANDLLELKIGAFRWNP